MNVWICGGGGIGGEIAKLLRVDHDVFESGKDDCNVGDRSWIDSWLRRRHPDVMEAMVYTAGRNHLDYSMSIDPTEMLKAYSVNCVGLVRCLQACPTLRRVVVIGSDAATRPMRTSIAYNASKAALHAAVKVIARERAETGFVINVVAPGLIANTDMTNYVVERTTELRPDLDVMSYMIDQIPFGSPGRKIDVAVVTKWLLEFAPRYLNGSIIEVNGAR